MSDIKVTYYIGPTIQNYFYHSAGWTSVTVGKHIKSLTALACPEAVACVAHFHSGMLCIWLWYTESFVPEQGLCYTIVTKHTDILAETYVYSKLKIIEKTFQNSKQNLNFVVLELKCKC